MKEEPTNVLDPILIELFRITSEPKKVKIIKKNKFVIIIVTLLSFIFKYPPEVLCTSVKFTNLKEVPYNYIRK
jgi:hypothetical protein